MVDCESRIGFDDLEGALFVPCDMVLLMREPDAVRPRGKSPTTIPEIPFGIALGVVAVDADCESASYAPSLYHAQH